MQIPTSKTCNEGPLPQGCVRAPPIFEGPTYIVDGVRDSQEYWGAVEIPYANTTARASGGHVLATITDHHMVGNAETLHLYLEQIPVDINARELVVYVDRDRFTLGTSSVEPTNDRAFAINLETGALATRAPAYRFGTSTWRPASSFGAVSAMLSPAGCAIAEGQIAPIRRCNAELAIELPADPLAAPEAGVLAGIGLAVADDRFGSALPEELVQLPALALARSFDRTFFCLDIAGPAAVREKQLVQLGAFVERVTGSAPGHFSIIAGDFNTNGRQIGPTRRHTGFGYGRILGELALGAAGAPDFEPAPDDNVSPWPSAFDWDIDHGDIARETDRTWLAEPCVGDLCSIGTSLDTDFMGGDTRAEATTCDYLKDERLDYIMVRPPIAPDIPTAETPQYVISREASRSNAWTSTWPVIEERRHDGVCEVPPALLSDHRMVVGAIGVIPLRVPPRYHPLWEHDVAFHISSYDATGESDCFLDLCSPIDARSLIAGRRLKTDGSIEPVPGTPGFGAECEGSTASAVTKACMSNWGFFDHEVPSDYLRLDSQVTRFFDSDDLSGDDTFDLMEPGQTPVMRFVWATGTVSVFDARDVTLVPASWPMDYAVFNNDPIRWRSRDRPINISLELRFDEAP